MEKKQVIDLLWYMSELTEEAILGDYFNVAEVVKSRFPDIDGGILEIFRDRLIPLLEENRSHQLDMADDYASREY